MGETTGISWTDATANFWMGCTRVSEACKFCYADRDMTRYGKDFNTVTRAKGIWTDILNPNKFKPGSKVFTCSWSDFFHAGADQWRPEAWECIRQRPDLTFQILTKRPERIAANLPPDWGKGWPNVWMGTTVENQRAANKRIPILLLVPAVLRFVSCEPLLGPVDLTEVELPEQYNLGPSTPAHINALTSCDDDHYHNDHAAIGWVIAGGESGPNARPSHPVWFRALREQCRENGVPFHFKQWGEWGPVDLQPETWHDFMDYSGRIGQCRKRADGTWAQDMFGTLPAVIERQGIKRTGRLLDGVLWDEMPA